MNLLKVFLTSFFSFIYLFFLVKLTGNRQISELGMFDYVSSISIGSIAAELATDLENWYYPLLAMTIYGVLTALMPILENKFSPIRSFMSGKTLLLCKDGKLYMENFKRAKIDLNEFLASLREKGFFKLSDVSIAIWEYNGKISILPASAVRPATPADFSLTPEQDKMEISVIADGRVFEKNLCFYGKDERWLEQQLKNSNLKKEEIFLAVVADGKLLVYDTDQNKKEIL